MNALIVLPTDNKVMLAPGLSGAGWRALPGAERLARKDERSRLRKYGGWLDDGGRVWHKPDLALYRDDLRAGRAGRALAPATILAHLGTVRARYRVILRDRDLLYSLAGALDDAPGDKATLALLRKAMVDELTTRIKNAIDPESAPVKLVSKQDVDGAEHLRLSRVQAGKLLGAPGLDSVLCVRDSAILALLLCTGIRERELVNLDVGDLRRAMEDGTLALRIRNGKGCKQRLVPFGALEECLLYVDAWLALAEIKSGPVFRGLYRGDAIRPTRLTTQAVGKVMRRYPVMVGGRLRHVQPHDCRRTYARRLFDEGLSPVLIQKNLGHVDLKTTLAYIGDFSGEQRKPPAAYDFDGAALATLATMGQLALEGPSDA